MSDNDNILCACGGKCEGVCRKKNLYRQRTYGSICPSAYSSNKDQMLRNMDEDVNEKIKRANKIQKIINRRKGVK